MAEPTREHLSCPPILFVVFNRPDITRRVFEEIRHARPRRLYVAADGPREGRTGEVERCQETRRVAERVDWPCEVKTLLSDRNLGCRVAVSGAITWFFENEEEGIILEDDCLPNQTFFPYCAELLERYRGNETVMHISGWSPCSASDAIPTSYSFSLYPHAWGWATWRRAWGKYVSDPSSWEAARKDGAVLRALDGRRRLARMWSRTIDNAYVGRKINTWDYQWVLSCWVAGGLSISPKYSMVQNIGFGADATHTVAGNEEKRSERSVEMPIPLTHPNRIFRDAERDSRIEERDFMEAEKFRPLGFAWTALRKAARILSRKGK